MVSALISFLIGAALAGSPLSRFRAFKILMAFFSGGPF